MVTFLIVVADIMTAMALWSLYCHLRGWWWGRWSILGFGITIFQMQDFRWTMDLGFTVPYWFYLRFRMKIPVLRICTLWEVPEKDLPLEYKDAIIAHRKQRKEAC
jgi:hypothetical protein